MQEMYIALAIIVILLALAYQHSTAFNSSSHCYGQETRKVYGGMIGTMIASYHLDLASC